jgi:protocatechuate 3,4-dioxygenase beta subunit
MGGPFFTPLSPERANLIERDMTATSMVLVGEVVDAACRPVSGALLDFWQSDDRGRYDNQGYRLRGHQYANRQGEFTLKTLLPGEYPGRTPHIHVKVQRENGPILTTQLYLPDHPRNQRDFLFQPSLTMTRRNGAFYFRFVLA